MTMLELHTVLCEQIKRINDADRKGDDLMVEIRRSKAMGQLARAEVKNVTNIIEAKRLVGDIDKAFVTRLIGNNG